MIKAFLSILILLTVGAFAVVSAKPVFHGASKRSTPVCTGSQLSVTHDPEFEGDAAMGGQRGEQFLVKNISRRSCAIKGTPGVALFDSKGHRMGQLVGPAAGALTILKAGEKATFEFGYHSCEFAANMAGKSPKRCKMTATAQVRFRGISKVFSVREKIDAVRGVESVIEFQKK